MKVSNIYLSSCSACFELSNDSCYFSPEEYDVYLNGELIKEKLSDNVLSLFNLLPDTKYTLGISLSDELIDFTTNKESCVINIRDFGAVGDGKTNDTNAIQMAITACPDSGRIRIPEGMYFITPITLKSNITIEIQKGAKLLGSTSESDYTVLPGMVRSDINDEVIEFVSWEGCPVSSHQSLLCAYHAKNIHIVGEGIIDGDAANSIWWIDVKKREIARPKLLFTNQCEGIYIHGVNFMNSPCWHIHPYNSKNIGAYDINIMAPKDSPNTDGFNPESCDNVEIIGALFSVGDDAIAIKSGKMYEGKLRNIPASNHTIRNCMMEFAHGAVVLGSEMSGGIKNLNVTKCYFKNTDRGLRIKTRRGRGKDAVVDGVVFSNIRMDGVLSPLVINMFYFCDADGKSEYVQSKKSLLVDDRTPYLGTFKFTDMKCTNCSVSAGFFYGLPEMPIEEIEINNIDITFADETKAGYPAMMCDIDKLSKSGFYFNNVNKVKMNNVKLSGVVGEKFKLHNVYECVEK